MKWLKRKNKKEKVEVATEEKVEIVKNITENDISNELEESVVSAPSFLNRSTEKQEGQIEHKPNALFEQIDYNLTENEQATGETIHIITEQITYPTEQVPSNNNNDLADSQKEALKNEMQDFLEEMKKKMRG